MLQTFRTCLAVGMMLLSGNQAMPEGQALPKDSFSTMQQEEAAVKAETPPFIFSYTQEEVDMMTAVVMHEVGYCSRESKIAVANVILNRVKDGRFGKTIYDVLHAKNQFTAINNYYAPRIVPDEQCKEAVLAALAGEDNSHGALYFCNPNYVNSARAKVWFAQLDLVFQIDGQNYYR